MSDSSMHLGELFVRGLSCPPRWAEAVVGVAGHEVHVIVEDLLTCSFSVRLSDVQAERLSVSRS